MLFRSTPYAPPVLYTNVEFAPYVGAFTDTNPPVLMVNVPLMVELVPKLIPDVVLTLFKLTTPDIVCVAVPANIMVCVPEKFNVPELEIFVPDVLLLIVSVFVVPLNVMRLFITRLLTNASVFCVTA